MFLGKIVLDERKKSGMTQTELASGICNQNVISKLEKHNVMPTLSVLIRLCRKLDLTLNDLFSDFASNTDSESHELLIMVEKKFLLGESQAVASRLKLIDEQHLKKADRIIYSFLTGALLVEKAPDTSLFIMDKVLMLTQNDTYNIYTELAYLTKGNVYMLKDNLVQAGAYYGLIEQALQANLLISNARPVELLYICQYIAKYYLDKSDQSKVFRFCNEGIELAEKEHVTFFVDYLYFYLMTVKDRDDDDFETKRQMALALSTMNHHDELKEKIKQF